MRERGPVLLVLSVFDAKLFLRKAKFYLRKVRNAFRFETFSIKRFVNGTLNVLF